MRGGLLDLLLLQRFLEVAPHLVLVLDFIHQALGLRLAGKKWAFVDGGPDLGLGPVPPPGDGRHQVAKNVVRDPVDHFPCLGAHGGAGVAVAKILVFSGVLHFHLHTKLVERTLVIHQPEGDALHVEPVGRPDVDFRRTGGQVVVAAGGGSEVGVDGFAGFAELIQIVPDLLHLGPAEAGTFGLEH